MKGSVERSTILVVDPGRLRRNIYKLSELTPSTTYNIEVAAVNSAGVGEFSTLQYVHTLGNA